MEEQVIFRLGGVVKNKNGAEDFEGPLTLILLLLSRNKIEINDIKISVILEQYLEYLEKMKTLDLEIASEFVTMASQLVYIKTKALLEGEEELSELDALISSLEELKGKAVFARVKPVLEPLYALWETGSGLYTKQPEPLKKDRAYEYEHEAAELREALLGMTERQELFQAQPTVVVPKKIIFPVEEKLLDIQGKLRKYGWLPIRQLLGESRSRSELVAAFIALLEMCKAGSVYFTGDGDNCIASIRKEGDEDGN